MVWCAIGVVVAAVLLLLAKDFVFRSNANEASSSAYVQFVHAVYAEVNRIFLFAQRIGDYHEVRRILDEVSVTGQVDPEVREYGRLPDPMLTCIVVQDFVMCYRRLGNRVAAGPFTWERVSLGIMFTRFFKLTEDSGSVLDIWANRRTAMRLLKELAG